VQKSATLRFFQLTLTAILVYSFMPQRYVDQLYYFVDAKLDGQWASSFPFKYLRHPHPDTFKQFEEICEDYGY